MHSTNKPLSLFNEQGLFSREFLAWMESEKAAVLLETGLIDNENGRHHIFRRPSAILQANTFDEVEPALKDVERALRGGAHVAGYLTYEAGYAFEPVLSRHDAVPAPLLWLGVFDDPVTIHARSLRPETGERTLREILEEFAEFSPSDEPAGSIAPRPGMAEEEYRGAIDRIRHLIVEGETYQVNFTFKLRFPAPKMLAPLYDVLRQAQRVAYGAFLHTGTLSALSFSPELFFRFDGEILTLRPMKGTAPRGRTPEEDSVQREWLRTSEKNRAENLMIVDLLRNDAGKIAQPGKVRVDRLYSIERYETLFQATSTITAGAREKVRPIEIFRSLFPCGSITGAPKIRTMQIIRELEKEPRGLYTGSIGYLAPDRKAVFNVAIRTVVIDRKSGQAEYGVGGGITGDSDPASEYQECLLKSRFLTEPWQEFELIETIRWEYGKGLLILEEHWERLKRSAEYFCYHYDERMIMRDLSRLEGELEKRGEGAGAFRIRLTLARNGKTTITHSPLEETEEPVRVKMSLARTNSQDRFLFHKTTRRVLYEKELKDAMKEGYFDVLFCNEKGEVTEGARTNILIRKGSLLITPPVECGLLPGTFRAHLLKAASGVVERICTLDELRAADELLLCNALRGVFPASLEMSSFKLSAGAVQHPIQLEQERNKHGGILAHED